MAAIRTLGVIIRAYAVLVLGITGVVAVWTWVLTPIGIPGPVLWSLSWPVRK